MEIPGIDLPPLPQSPALAYARRRANLPQGIVAADDSTGEHFIEREPDALVLVGRRVTCTHCGSICESAETNLFVRRNTTFTITRQSLELVAHLPRERKIIQFEAERCLVCF
jgi:hypothetical protein